MSLPLLRTLLLLLVLPLCLALPPNATTSPTRSLSALHAVLISDYLRFHKAHRHTSPRLVYRLQRRQPGLGDRLTGLLHAYILAALSGRVLLLDWRFPFALSDLLLSNSAAAFYYTPADAALESRHPVRHCHHSCPPTSLAPLLSPAFSVILNVSQPLRPADIFALARRHPSLPAPAKLLSASALGTGPLLPADLPPDAQLFARLFSAILRPSPAMLRFMHTYAAPLTARPYIAVHARLGTGVSEGGPRFEPRVPWESLAACLATRARAMSRRLATNATIFLATDTPAFRPTFRRAVVNDGGSPESVLYGSWGTKHIGRMNEDSQTDAQLFKFALMELLLLAKGKGMVSTVSRFAKVAAFVGGITEHELIVPETDC